MDNIQDIFATKKKPWLTLIVCICVGASLGPMILVGTAFSQGLRPPVDVQLLEALEEEPSQNITPGVPETGPSTGTQDGTSVPLASVKVAVLQALDKVTARVSKIEAEIGRPVRFGALDIIAHSCEKSPPEEAPEIAAFLEITEFRPDGEPITVFVGWMFASSPALSSMEHSVYDVWVFECRAKIDTG